LPTQPPVFYVLLTPINVLCNGGNNGAITSSVTGGVAPYTYLWSNAATTANISGLVAGVYSLTVTDHNGATATTTATVSQPPLMELICTHEDVSINCGCNGTATVSVTGGTSPYTYLWSNGLTTSSITGLAVGTYSVTVTDINGCSAICSQTVTTTSTCYYIDLGVTKMLTSPNILINDTIYHNDTVAFTITLTNHSTQYTSHDIVLLDILPQELTYVSSTPSSGTYDPATGFWLISALGPQQSETLIISAIVDTNTVNDVYILSQSGVDTNYYNNFYFASVTITSTSGGNDGGVESNGNMASKLALRNYNRHKEYRRDYQNAYQLELFTSLSQSSSLKSTKNSDLVDFIPQSGPLNSAAYVTTPEDLLGITNATEIFSVDYFVQQESRKAVVLAMATNSGTVYEHTKMVCDRLNGARLEHIKYVIIKGRPFIITQLQQDNGDIDWAVSFIAYKDANGYTIDNQWDLNTYQPMGNEEVLNYQVWSLSEVYTTQLVSTILDNMEQKGYSVRFVNESLPVVPSVYVKTGYYENGNLVLDMVNTGNSESLTMTGTKAYVEDGERYPMTFNTGIDTTSETQLVIPTDGYIFDIGFAIKGSNSVGKDMLYMADGPWGPDYDSDGAEINNFTILPQIDAPVASAYNMGRSASLEGSVKTYASMFRVLKVGNKSVDVSKYNMLEFEAIGTGAFEVVISKKGITSWSQQYRTSITLNSETATMYQIPFTQFANNAGDHNFETNDVVAVVFTKKGDGSTYQNFSITVDKLRMITGQIETEDETTTEMDVYPNPMHESSLISFNLPEATKVNIGLYNIEGQLVKVIASDNYDSGIQHLNFSVNGINNGVYFIKLDTDYSTDVKRVVVMQ
ncbi:MAG: T9SS type A sorting domain-containing protein, partial [Bacteroidales bacterium]|nr:T9SS type A sorting domain-containing protein [Bacteroidales bacterium]